MLQNIFVSLLTQIRKQGCESPNYLIYAPKHKDISIAIIFGKYFIYYVRMIVIWMKNIYTIKHF